MYRSFYHKKFVFLSKLSEFLFLTYFLRSHLNFNYFNEFNLLGSDSSLVPSTSHGAADLHTTISTDDQNQSIGVAVPQASTTGASIGADLPSASERIQIIGVNYPSNGIFFQCLLINKKIIWGPKSNIEKHFFYKLIRVPLFFYISPGWVGKGLGYKKLEVSKMVGQRMDKTLVYTEFSKMNCLDKSDFFT